MARIIESTSTRRTWAPMSKAMPDVVTARDLGGLARLTSPTGGLNGYGQVTIPAATEQALEDQGMQTGGAFSPGRPIQQFAPWGMDPRTWDYSVGFNVTTRPRAGTGRVSFETLASFINAWDVARLCINHIQRDIRSMDWSIVPKYGIESDEEEAVKQATAIMEKPDGSTPFDSWQWKFLEDVLRYDAGTLYRQRNRMGKVQGLEVISGTTISPLVEYYGREPTGDAPAYVQYISGIPWQWLRNDSLIYLPFAPLPESVYGLPVIEWLMLTGNTDLRFQWHFLLYFTEGTMPQAFMEAPPDVSNPENIVRFQAAWDAAMEGDQSQKHKIRFIPSDSKPTIVNNKDFNPEFPLYLTRKVCGAFGITPNDIGITDAVNKASADTQVDVQFRIGTMPVVRHLQGIYSRYLQEDRGLPVEFQFDTGREKEDRLQEAQAWDLYIRNGTASVDDAREQVLGLPVNRKNPTPRFMVTRTGVVPLVQIVADSGEIDPATAAPIDSRIEQVHADGDLVARTIEAPEPLTPEAPTKPEIQGLKPAPAEQSDEQAVSKSEDDDDSTEGFEKALAGWRKAARSRIRRGAQPRPYRWMPGNGLEPPAEVQAAVWAQLGKARSLEEVDAAFRIPLVLKAVFSKRPLRSQIEAAEGYHGRKLAEVLTQALPLRELILQYLAAHPVAKAAGDQPGASTGQPAANADLQGALASIYADGYLLGAASTVDQSSQAGQQLTLSGAATVASAFNWNTWKPGNPLAAALLTADTGDSGFKRLLDRQGVTIQGLTDSALQSVGNVIAQGAAAGDSVDTIEANLRDLVGSRARTIANTELNRAVSAATLDTYQANDVAGKQWLTYQPCPICQANEDAGVIPVGEDFPGGVDAPPQHPNCRCSLAPAPLPESEEEAV